jgi:HD domain
MDKEIMDQLTPLPERNPHEPTYQLWPYWAMPEDIMRITNALVIAMYQHNNAAKVKTRKYNGHPYIVHPIRVALAVSSYPRVKLFWVSAALLHDTVEDTVYTPEEVFILKHRIMTECGEDVLKLVEELTNEEHDKSIPRWKRKATDRARLSKVSKAAKIIKMLDRIDNLKEMIGAPVDFKKLYCKESEELLKVVGDGDKDIAYQLRTAIEFPYIWRRFNQVELEQKPFGTVFEHSKHGECFIEESGPGGHMKFADGKSFYFSGKIDSECLNPFDALMRETGTSIKKQSELQPTEKKNEGTANLEGLTGCR